MGSCCGCEYFNVLFHLNPFHIEGMVLIFLLKLSMLDQTILSLHSIFNFGCYKLTALSLGHLHMVHTLVSHHWWCKGCSGSFGWGNNIYMLIFCIFSIVVIHIYLQQFGHSLFKSCILSIIYVFSVTKKLGM